MWRACCWESMLQNAYGHSPSSHVVLLRPLTELICPHPRDSASVVWNRRLGLNGKPVAP